ncbi:MAG: hypothetical protein HYY06_31140 [Deltaproteobacteria bacterium]|nr:hypothetical protein [Deltaproteobacteria bacterium]
MPVPQKLETTEIAREIGGLALSCVRAENPMLLIRAATWRNTLRRIGVHVPFFVVHDIGLVLCADEAAAPLGPRERVDTGLQGAAGDPGTLSGQYTELLRDISSCEVVDKARAWRLEDELVAVLLAKLLGQLFDRWPERRLAPIGDNLPMDPDLYANLGPQIGHLFARFDRTAETSFLRFICQQRLHLLTAVEQVDLDTLRLLGLFGGEAGAAGLVDLMDLFQVFSSPEANDVINFSLDILPSVLETKRANCQQTFSVDGYSGLTRRGHLDNLLLSEMAYDDDLFEARYLENELFYYAHEKQREEERRLHYIVVDASASMRGVRQVFARGLALTLTKKLSLRGEDVYLRFFDSRLYDLVRVRNGSVNVPYLLCFRSERGRNYAKVFSQLHLDLLKLQRRERRSAALYIVTHAECHIPVDLVDKLRKSAFVYGVFILPSGEVELDYLTLLHRHQIVDAQTLMNRKERAERALEIIDDAARMTQPPPPPPGTEV